METTNKPELKYLSFLMKVHELLKYTDKISVTKVANEVGITTVVTTVALKGGLIKKVKGITTWETKTPDIHMAKELMARTKKYASEVNRIQREKRLLKKAEEKAAKLDEERKRQQVLEEAGKEPMEDMKQKMAEAKRKPPTSTVKSERKRLRLKETKFLFGLIAIKTTYHYE